MSSMKKAIDLLESFVKAQSAGRTTVPSEPQAQRAYNQSFARFPLGETGDPTPDMPDQGSDWHGEKPGEPQVTEENGDQEKAEEAFKDPEEVLGEDKKTKKKGPPDPVNLMAPTADIQKQAAAQQQQQPAAPQITAKSLTDLAIKSLAGAPRFTTGPITPPKEKKFLLEQGFAPEDIDAGAVSMTPRMRAQFNRDLLSAVQKSVRNLYKKIESK